MLNKSKAIVLKNYDRINNFYKKITFHYFLLLNVYLVNFRVVFENKNKHNDIYLKNIGQIAWA